MTVDLKDQSFQYPAKYNQQNNIKPSHKPNKKSFHKTVSQKEYEQLKSKHDKLKQKVLNAVQLMQSDQQHEQKIANCILQQPIKNNWDVIQEELQRSKSRQSRQNRQKSIGMSISPMRAPVNHNKSVTPLNQIINDLCFNNQSVDQTPHHFENQSKPADIYEKESEP
eukprot:403366598